MHVVCSVPVWYGMCMSCIRIDRDYILLWKLTRINYFKLLAASSLSNLHSNSLVSQVCTSGPCSETHLVYMGKDEYHAYRVVLDPGMLCKPSLLMSWQCGPILSSISLS